MNQPGIDRFKIKCMKKNFTSLRLFLALVACLLLTACGQKENPETESGEDLSTEQAADAPRLSLAEQVEKLAAELESEAETEEDKQETKARRKRLEFIQQAQETSELREKTCEEIIDEYEEAIRNYMKGEGSQEDYTRFNNDPFFTDCRNQDETHRDRIRALRAELREFSRNR